MKKLSFYASILLAVASLSFNACGESSESTSSYSDDESYEYSDDEEIVRPPLWRNTMDVYIYLNHKTFSGNGLSLRFYNDGRCVDIRRRSDIDWTPLSTDVRVYDIGINGNGVAYATVQVYGLTTNGVTTFTLLAVEKHAQLIDPNDGAVYEF